MEAQEAFENLQLAKHLIIQYLENVTISTVENEQRLSVIYKILMLSDSEITSLTTKRTNLTQKNVQDNVKKGVLGGLFKKK